MSLEVSRMQTDAYLEPVGKRFLSLTCQPRICLITAGNATILRSHTARFIKELNGEKPIKSLSSSFLVPLGKSKCSDSHRLPHSLSLLNKLLLTVVFYHTPLVVSGTKASCHTTAPTAKSQSKDDGIPSEYNHRTWSTIYTFCDSVN